MQNLVIGVDIGTSSTKTVLMSSTGEVLASAHYPYTMYRPHPGWAQNDPDDWVKAVTDSVRQVVAEAGIDPERVRAMCIVSQRDPIVLLDEHNQVLAPSISWTDRRDVAGAEAIYNHYGKQRLVETTGLLPVPGLTLPNIYWIRNHWPDAWKRARRVLSTKDYVLFRLTGKIATDFCTPSRSMLYDVRKREWAAWILDEAGIDPGLLPAITHQPWEPWGELSPEAAERLGLKAGTIIAAGGGDDPAAALGAGAIQVGDVVVGTGTASCWRIVLDEPRPDSNRQQADMAPHVIPDRFIYELVVAGTGTSLRWFNQTFGALGEASRNPYERLLEEAATVPPGADGLMFYPYLEGARAPRFNEGATGVFFGLLTSHTRAHCVRAIVEGIAFQYPPILDMLAAYTSATPRTLTLVDDEAKSTLWNQIKADAMNRSVYTPHTLNAAALGSAILAALAGGLFPNVEEAAKAMIGAGDTYTPDPQGVAIYGRVRERYERIYSVLDGAFRADPGTQPEMAAAGAAQSA